MRWVSTLWAAWACGHDYHLRPSSVDGERHQPTGVQYTQSHDERERLRRTNRVIGGLMREDVQKTEDKVPIIGDIPLVGRAFRTNTEQHTKKNLVIFVTAKIITPAGIPLNEEEEEGLLPPELPEVPAYKK